MGFRVSAPGNHTGASTTTFRAACRYDLARANGVSGPEDDSRHQPGGEQRTLTTSAFSGRSHPLARQHRRRSRRPSPPNVSEHFGHGDHFAKLHPICTHLQGMNTRKVLTSLTCRYSPTRRHRVPLTAVQCR